MQYIGIDVSSKKLNIHILGKTQKENFEIPNTKEAVEEFIKNQKLRSSVFIVGAESTGKYHLICQNVFVNKSFEFRLLNPIITKKIISSTIRNKKTDKSDAEIIAFLLSQGEGQIISAKQLDATKKAILRARKTIVQHNTAIKLLIAELKKENQNNEIQSAISTLENLSEQMKESAQELENEVIKNTSEDEQLIRSLPGFATRLAAVVSAETGDFSRFPSAKQFKAYVGIDPKVTQSGNSLMTGRITKRGNPYLRCAFYLAAQVARQHDPELKQFYEKKISEGKNFRVAICAVARKLCERVYAVVINKRPYVIRQVENVAL